MHLTRPVILNVLAIVVVLGVVAAVAPAPASSDRGIYQQVGRELLIRDCADGHCFRPLVAGVLEQIPGPSMLKWKAYAVVANAIAALAVGQFCLLLGASISGSIAAAWIAALGTGALYSLFDCYTSDPLMYMLGPLMAIALWQGRIGRAGVMGAVGVFAKEFAAAPLWIFTVMAALERRWTSAVRLLLTASAVTLVWLSLHTTLMALENYRYGASASADLLHGGFLATWLRSVGPAGALTYLFTCFGALYLLLPLGLARGGRDLRMLALAAVPSAAVFVYVEQPERALWNFHFIVIPVAILVLQVLPGWMLALFVASFGVVNLRYGAQLPIRATARMSLLVSLAIAVVAVVLAWRRNVTAMQRRPVVETRRMVPGVAWTMLGGEALVALLLAVALFDVRAHRQVEAHLGLNQWGFRGPLQSAKHPGVRIAVVGGSAAFAPGTAWSATMPAQLAAAVNQRRRWTVPGGPFANVDNLSEPRAGADSYITTLRDYEYLHPDIVCVYDGYDDQTLASAERGRRRSFVFRSLGYLPAPWDRVDAESAGAPIRSSPTGSGDPSCAAASASYCSAIAATVRFALQQGQAVVVATPPYASARHEAQQRSLGDALGREFGREPRFRYLDLGDALDVARLADVILDVMPRRSREQGS